MTDTLKWSRCYNKGCGIEFNPEDNAEDACTYHPGAPIFHDAYKGWSCCNKKSTDFTTFLNTKGCTVGKHNPVKPPEPLKAKLPDNSNEVITVSSNLPPDVPRPDYNSPFTKLPSTVTSSLKKLIEGKTAKADAINENETEELSTHSVKIGESCKNNSCKSTYEGEHSNLEMCLHHPGFPVFHEGMKYWSCCNKKTSDFNEFLEQIGCTTGSHVWIKKETKKVDMCRQDWHQTPSHIFVTFYAKNCDPSNTLIEANGVRLKVSFVFEESKKFETDLHLKGVIDPVSSSVTLAGTKVEIKLRKADLSNWSKLSFEEKPRPEPDKSGEESNHGDLNVDAIDLSDI